LLKLFGKKIMTIRNPTLSFAIPGILACLMVLGSATFLIGADSIKEEILIVCVTVIGIASACWVIGIIQTSRERQWSMISISIAIGSLFGLAVIGAISAYWFVNLLPLIRNE
jgi:hypothetical protein